MKPSQIASNLRRIATRIENSKNPSRTLVGLDLRRMLTAMDEPTDVSLIKVNDDGTAVFHVKGIFDGQNVDVEVEFSLIFLELSQEMDQEFEQNGHSDIQLWNIFKGDSPHSGKAQEEFEQTILNSNAYKQAQTSSVS